jgi:hypothetical protein
MEEMAQTSGSHARFRYDARSQTHQVLSRPVDGLRIARLNIDNHYLKASDAKSTTFHDH